MPTDKYLPVDLHAGNNAAPGAGFPGRVLVLTGTYAKTAADTDLSVLRLGKVPVTAIPLPWCSSIENDAIAGFTSVNLGAYKVGEGKGVISANCFDSAVDLHLVNTGTKPFSAVTLGSRGKNIRDILALTIGTRENIDIALNGATLGANTGNIAWTLCFLIPQQ